MTQEQQTDPMNNYRRIVNQGSDTKTVQAVLEYLAVTADGLNNAAAAYTLRLASKLLSRSDDLMEKLDAEWEKTSKLNTKVRKLQKELRELKAQQ